MNNIMKSVSAIIVFSLLILIIINFYSSQSDHVPVTTSSEKALKYYNKALSLSDRLRFEEAQEFYLKAIELDSNFAMARLNYAMNLGSPKERLSQFERLFELTDKVSDGEKLWIQLIRANFDNNNQLQFELSESLNNKYPNDERVKNLYAGLYFNQQNYDSAILLYQQAIEINPDYSPPYNQLGYSYRYLKDYDKSEEMFQDYIKLIPNDPNPYDSYAELLLEKGEFEASIQNYEKALSINPYFVFSHTGVAANLNYLDRHVDARNQLQKMYKTAKTDPYRATALTHMAISYVDEGNYNAALKYIHKRFDLSEKNSDTISIFNDYLMMANISAESGNLDNANHYLKQSQNLVDNIPAAFHTNGKINYIAVRIKTSLLENKIDEAKKHLAVYDKLVDDNANYLIILLHHQLRGMIALAENNFEMAAKELKQSNLQSPYNMYRLGQAYEGLADSDSALTYYRNAALANVKDNINYAFIRKAANNKVAELNQ